MANEKRPTLRELKDEIEQLEASPYVKLARMEAQLVEQYSSYLEELKKLEHRGRVLEGIGISLQYLQGIAMEED